MPADRVAPPLVSCHARRSARALAGGDALGALKLVALRDDAPALALRGIAMAQLGDYAPHPHDVKIDNWTES